jgi:hypothetical protein
MGRGEERSFLFQLFFLYLRERELGIAQKGDKACSKNRIQISALRLLLRSFFPQTFPLTASAL